MDETDVKILNILSENSNTTTTDMTTKVNLSIPAINKRIQKLCQSGMIQRFTVLIDPRKAGKPIQAFILIVVQQEPAIIDRLMQYVEDEPDILECCAVTGEYDYLLKVRTKDVESLEDKLLFLKRQMGITKSHTMLSLLEHKFRPSVLPDSPQNTKQ